MTCYGAKEMRASFDTVRRNTITLAEEIPAERYDFRAAPGCRSAGEMLAHVAVAPMWQIDLHGSHVDRVDFERFGAHLAEAAAAERALNTKEAIVQALRDNGERLSEFFGSLTNATLEELVSFPPPIQPPVKTRFEMLLGIKEHEMHHRGQLMLIERMIGIVPHLTRAREAFRAPVTSGVQAAGGARIG